MSTLFSRVLAKVKKNSVAKTVPVMSAQAAQQGSGLFLLPSPSSS